MRNTRKIIIVLVIVAAFMGLLWVFRSSILRLAFGPTGTSLPTGIALETVGGEQTGKDSSAVSHAPVEVVANGLRIPWEIVFLPDGDMLVTERPGTLRRIGRDGSVIDVPGVTHVGEGGLLGMALHPDFATNNYLYLYMTTDEEGALSNRIERYVYKDGELQEPTRIFGGIPGAKYHDGGRIAFGGDGMLYVTTGDAGDAQAAQDRNSLSGKILRLNDDGSVPDGNPFDNAVWSYGHRNPQGIAWDVVERLWQTEHGRSGVHSGMDEVNLIRPGLNYGWPTIEGGATREGMMTPRANSGADETWAPGDVVWVDGSLFFTGLRGEALYEARPNQTGDIEEIVVHFQGDFGRLRTVVSGPDKALYVTTSNTDGRGEPREDDDKIIRLDLTLFR